jgi:hypothetical protein
MDDRTQTALPCPEGRELCAVDGVECECERRETERLGSEAAEARAAFCDYIVSDGYRRLLHRAIASRLGTTSAHEAEHMKAIALFDAAFPEEAL